MKRTLYGILGLLFIVLINGCSRDPNPQIRIMNKQAEKINVKIQTEAGSKLAIDDIEPGETTPYQSTVAGNITATAVIQNESISFLAAKNTNYTIIISPGKAPSLHIDQ